MIIEIFRTNYSLTTLQYSLVQLPYVIAIWAMAATGGPALGPLLAGFSVAAESWRW